MSKDIIVIKLGGSIFEEKDTSLDDIADLYKKDQQMVIVHGGGAKVSLWLSKMNIPVKIVDGERATTSESLEVVAAVLGGLVNKEIVSALLDKGVKACGLSGVDGSIIKGKMRGGEMGLMGDISRVDTNLLQVLLNKGFVPVVSPVSLNQKEYRRTENERLLNINGDPFAGALACALKAKHLIFLTDTDGVKDQGGYVINKMTSLEASALVANGTATGGMIPKLNAAKATAANGTQTAIIDGRKSSAILRQLNGDNLGTIIKG